MVFRMKLRSAAGACRAVTVVLGRYGVTVSRCYGYREQAGNRVAVRGRDPIQPGAASERVA